MPFAPVHASHFLGLVALALAASLVVACSSDSGSGTGKDTGGDGGADVMGDTPSGDTPTGDTTPDTTPGCIDPDNDGYGEGQCILQGVDCAPDDSTRFPGAPEICNGLDDNCDDVVDEGFDLTTDINNCGVCGMVCTGANATGGCDAGACTVSACDAGFYDIDLDASNGCEYACDPVAPGAETCDGEDNDCNGLVDDGFDLMIDPLNCGMCGVACTPTTGATDAVCDMGACAVSGCDMNLQDCDADYTNGCEADLTSLAHCTACNNACDFGPNTVATCGAMGCEYAGCAMGFDDCDGDPANGCEVDLSTGTTCVCTPGATRPCYTGAPGTENVGVCHGGLETCGATGTFWLFGCVGEVIPMPEICGSGFNEDCVGVADDGLDADGDGWTVCQNDCCDSTMQGCTAPEKVNPGAYDYVDPTGMATPYDDDCDGTADNPLPTTCAPAFDITNVTGTDLANAMDICQTTTAMGDTWGLISADLTRADGTGVPVNVQVGVLNSFGTNVTPRANSSLATLSSGTARDQDSDGDDGGYIFPDGNGHQDPPSDVLAPADYLAANGGQLQSAPGCPVSDTTVHDSVRLRLRIRVPTNALSFSFNLKFYSAEYPEWVCDSFNDFFLAQLYTTAPGIPADHNISFDALGNPISVNNGFFEVCQGCPSGTAELVNTGYPTNDAGGTDWLQTTAPVTPGEVMELHFHIWDTGDHAWDSLILLDNFEWSLDPSSVGTSED